jgi:murein DD-endopeptidase MepM/ murein hydrolase activator NlpD
LKLPALVLKNSYPAATTDLTEAFLARVVPLLLPEYQKLAREMGRQYKKISPEDLVEGFRIINEDYRKLLDLVFERIFAQTEQKRLWNGAFQRPLAGAPTAPFGESRTYLFQGRAVSASMHTGVDLASIEHDPIVAANSGRVAFAGFLGIYGDAVVIDHGLGLFTLYGHLSSVDCRVGKMLDAGDVLGKTGMTGLAGGDHLHYEVRLDGVPERPLEWWDAKWINDHIEQKIAEMKKMVD